MLNITTLQDFTTDGSYHGSVDSIVCCNDHLLLFGHGVVAKAEQSLMF